MYTIVFFFFKCVQLLPFKQKKPFEIINEIVRGIHVCLHDLSDTVEA